MLRTCFILGNLTTAHDECRVFVLETAGAIEQLLGLLEQLCEQSFRESEREEGKADSSVDETLVKLIRLIANLAINEEVGMMVSQEPSAMLLCRVIESKSLAEQEELVLNAVSAITNLSFYPQPLNAVLHHETIAELLVPLLLHDNHEAKVEAARCYGNLSRYPEVRRLMKSKRVDEILCILLDHPQQSVLVAVCGVLMNVAADPLFRRGLAEYHAVQKLIAVLEQLSLTLDDLPLATLLCKTFFNLALTPTEGGADAAVMSSGEAGAPPPPLAHLRLARN